MYSRLRFSYINSRQVESLAILLHKAFQMGIVSLKLTCSGVRLFHWVWRDPAAIERPGQSGTAAVGSFFYSSFTLCGLFRIFFVCFERNGWTVIQKQHRHVKLFMLSDHPVGT